ncbi:hypothetical protein G4H71_02015 [Rhodococcus triatomae]|uniref:Uncharacterized protein n=1 Tax=Rhodococcus triatomae TaxID=300028 RepID=A0A1G8DU54_9NOCA|nr:hypothetical protein [Rhodococcus triatomae]QNG18345.1 hypothetical protein G4H72_06035 [Rhodococcus triatomae]QNG21985.1 hypothetical protein G4H71_02015 [Rhodococcus triatomae]SDH61197.1 hypothetical protein SAMN05444695_102408 [Rhodococcus triatomae]
MSILETALVFVAIPLAIVVLLGLGSVFGKKTIGPVPPAFHLGEKWDYPPVVWSAVDEVTTHGHHGTHHVVNDPAELIGGTANGKW